MSEHHDIGGPDAPDTRPPGTGGDLGGSTVEHALLIGVVATITVLLASAAEHYVTTLLPATLTLP